MAAMNAISASVTTARHTRRPSRCKTDPRRNNNETPLAATHQAGTKPSTTSRTAALGTTVMAAGASASHSTRMPRVRPQV